MTRYLRGDFTRTEFARHPDGRTAVRLGEDRDEDDPGYEYSWSFINHNGVWDRGSDMHMALAGWVPVQERGREGCDCPAHKVPWMTVAKNWEARAVKAEQERDEAEGQLLKAVQRADKAEQERDEARRHEGEAAERATQQARRAALAEGALEELARQGVTPPAEEPRPLTADDITDEMVERGFKRLAQLDRGGVSLRSTWAARQVIEAALTEPQRPEGAEELARLIATSDVGEWDCGDLADYLLSTGRVRLTGAES